VLLDDFSRGQQSQAGSPVRTFSAEKAGKNVFFDFIIHSCSSFQDHPQVAAF
jgi:hypothetical protein